MAGAVAAAPAAVPVQLAYAVLLIGVVGMVHGAGDLAIVPSASRPLFLLAYAAVSLATLLWWTADPAIALPAFLIASAVHFGMEDAPGGALPERVARGVALVATPAALHPAGYAWLLRTAGGSSASIAAHVMPIAVAGAIAGVALLITALRRRDQRMFGGIAALFILPPLIGFTLGFLILHALPQTAARRDRLGCSSTLAYLKTVAPIFAAAVVLAGMVGALLVQVDPSGIRGLFAGIAALAVPHLLVTPWFEREGRVQRPLLLAARVR